MCVCVCVCVHVCVCVFMSQEVQEVQQSLEKEQKKTKDLSSTVVRLNGIIKTGQDALSQEQKLVAQLQEQLAEKSKVHMKQTAQLNI